MSFSVVSPRDIKTSVQPVTIIVEDNNSEVIRVNDSKVQDAVIIIAIADLDDAMEMKLVDSRLDTTEIVSAVHRDNDEAQVQFLSQQAAATATDNSVLLTTEYRTFRQNRNHALAGLVARTTNDAALPWDPFVDRIRRFSELKQPAEFHALIAERIELGEGSTLELLGFQIIWAYEMRSANSALLSIPGVGFLRVSQQKGWE